MSYCCNKANELAKPHLQSQKQKHGECPNIQIKKRSSMGHGAALVATTGAEALTLPVSCSEMTVSKAPTRAFTLLFLASATSRLAVSSITLLSSTCSCFLVSLPSSCRRRSTTTSAPGSFAAALLPFLLPVILLPLLLEALVSAAAMADLNRSRLGVLLLSSGFSTLPRRKVSLRGCGAGAVVLEVVMGAGFGLLAIAFLGVSGFSVK